MSHIRLPNQRELQIVLDESEVNVYLRLFCNGRVVYDVCEPAFNCENMSYEEQCDFDKKFARYLVDRFNLKDIAGKYRFCDYEGCENDVVFSFALKKSKSLFVKTYTEKELNKIFNKYFPDIGISACEYEIDYYHKTDSSTYVRSYELELDQVLKRELTAREIYDIDVDIRDSTYTYTVSYRKIDKPYIEAKIAGNYVTKVVGTQFDGRAENHRNLKQGDRVLLCREPKNPYDYNAIMIKTEFGLDLGYIPRTMAAKVALPLDKNKAFVKVAYIMQTKTVNEENELLERPELQIQFVLKYKPPGRKPKEENMYFIKL